MIQLNYLVMSADATAWWPITKGAQNNGEKRQNKIKSRAERKYNIAVNLLKNQRLNISCEHVSPRTQWVFK
jgi:hypothetical protein